MAAKRKKIKTKKAKKKVKKKAVKKKAASKKSKKKHAVKIVRRRRLKCCRHCPDYEYCNDRDVCCEYCDYYLNGKCMYGKKSGLPTVQEGIIELPDYRGDDYGIDDYDAYESMYE